MKKVKHVFWAGYLLGLLTTILLSRFGNEFLLYSSLIVGVFLALCHQHFAGKKESKIYLVSTHILSILSFTISPILYMGISQQSLKFSGMVFFAFALGYLLKIIFNKGLFFYEQPLLCIFSNS